MGGKDQVCCYHERLEKNLPTAFCRLIFSERALNDARLNSIPKSVAKLHTRGEPHKFCSILFKRRIIFQWG